MSRIGKLPVNFSSNVQVALNGNLVSVKGPNGSLSFEFGQGITFDLTEGSILVKPISESKQSRSMWGLARSIVSNMIIGVSKGFEKRLEMTGVGYRAAFNDGRLVLFLGYSHDIIYAIPKEVQVVMEKPTVILLKSCDKQLLGQVAAEIRSLRPPEPYKGKGIKYEGERIVRKVGKKK
jgi:large subunit ribosomal protein L6